MDELDALIEEAMAAVRARKNRRDNPYVDDLIEFLLPHTNGIGRRQVIISLEVARKKKGLPIPEAFEEAIQSAFNQHTSQSYVFQKRKAPPSDDVFYSPGGKGSGVWAVRKDRAIAWLKARGMEERIKTP